jgi:protein-S-isoprenylcysteine O-methyltransferase Ste14
MGTMTSDGGNGESGRKVFAFFYGALVYIGVWCILLYIVGFVGNFFDPLLQSKWAQVIAFKSIDMGIQEPVWKAAIIDIALVCILGLQHSIMPRPWFKAWVTRFVPKHLERSTYIIFAICALSLLIWQWRPITTVIWNVDNPVFRVILQLISLGGWITVLVATFLVGHWKIFGVAQVLDYIEDKPYTHEDQEKPSAEFYPSQEFYRVGWPITRRGLWYYARHPDFFGFCTAFWVTPTMTVGHLIFALGLTIYIMFGIFFLERNLSDLYGEPYRQYVRTRSKIIPWFVKEND